MDEAFFNALEYVWLVLSAPAMILGFAVIPATLYGVLQCVKNTLDGKEVKEYLKTFIWTSVGLVLTFAPAIVVAFRY